MRRVLVILSLCSPLLWPQSTVTGSRTVQGNWDASGASATKPAKAGASLPATCSSGEFFFNTAAASGQNIYLCNPSNTWSGVAPGQSQTSASVSARAIGSTFSGGASAIPAGSVNYFTVPFACTISAWSMTIDTGSATIDVWKVATGTAIPTAANTITASAVPAISTGSALHSATVGGWTTSVNANDIIAFQIKAVSSATMASLVLECDQ